jgi:predicted house-cleaning noncanonical NTP pyrophosphatase (MazG superfamily)
MKTYNKIVRDRILETIRSKGQVASTRILDESEAVEALVEKLGEELDEFVRDRNLEELADLLEVIYALAGLLGHSTEELEAVRGRKEQERGGFKDRVFLESVE